MTVTLRLIAGALVAGAVACAPQSAPTPSQPTGGDTTVTPETAAQTIRTFREDANGSAITMSVGEVIRVELESIPTAGYIWNVAERPQFLELAGEGQRPTNPEKQNQPGYTGGNHYLATNFKAIAPGEGTLVLKEGRPWETDEPATDTFTLTVTVKAAG